MLAFEATLISNGMESTTGRINTDGFREALRQTVVRKVLEADKPSARIPTSSSSISKIVYVCHEFFWKGPRLCGSREDFRRITSPNG